MYEDEDQEDSSESAGVQSRFSTRLVAVPLAAFLCERAALAGGRGTSLRGAAMREIPGTPVHSSEGTPGGFAKSTRPTTSAGVNASGSTASPGASVESSPSISEEDKADDSPSSKLGGRASHKLKWLGETHVVRQGRTRGEPSQFDLDSAPLFAEEVLATEELQEWLSVSVMHDCLTRIDGLYNPLVLGAVNDFEDLAASAMNFAPSMWLNPLPDSGNGFGAVISERAFATADFDCREFPFFSTMEDPPISFADVERSQYQDVWNDSHFAEFSGLWSSNAFTRLIKM